MRKGGMEREEMEGGGAMEGGRGTERGRSRELKEKY